MYEIIRKTLIISICLVLSKVLHLKAGVYFVLYGTIIATLCPVNNLGVMLKILVPSFFVASGAVFINQMFANHPFIIWTLSVVYFDYVRKNADNNIKVRAALMPLFYVIFMDTYANSVDYIIAVPEILRDILISIIGVIIVAQLVNKIMPIQVQPVQTPLIVLPVTGADRLKMLCLVGGGLAFLMLNEITTATFCLVPVIISVMQPTHGFMKKIVRESVLTQIGGCCIAMLVSIIFEGTEINIITFFLMSFALVSILMKWCESSDPIESSIHKDAVSGILIPFQLYIGSAGNNFGLNAISLRAFELAVALFIVYFVAVLLERKKEKKAQRII